MIHDSISKVKPSIPSKNSAFHRCNPASAKTGLFAREAFERALFVDKKSGLSCYARQSYGATSKEVDCDISHIFNDTFMRSYKILGRSVKDIAFGNQYLVHTINNGFAVIDVLSDFDSLKVRSNIPARYEQFLVNQYGVSFVEYQDHHPRPGFFSLSSRESFYLENCRSQTILLHEHYLLYPLAAAKLAVYDVRDNFSFLGVITSPEWEGKRISSNHASARAFRNAVRITSMRADNHSLVTLSASEILLCDLSTRTVMKRFQTPASVLSIQMVVGEVFFLMKNNYQLIATCMAGFAFRPSDLIVAEQWKLRHNSKIDHNMHFLGYGANKLYICHPSKSATFKESISISSPPYLDYDV